MRKIEIDKIETVEFIRMIEEHINYNLNVRYPSSTTIEITKTLNKLRTKLINHNFKITIEKKIRGNVSLSYLELNCINIVMEHLEIDNILKSIVFNKIHKLIISL